MEDLELYFSWVNDYDVREQSFNSNLIKLDDHKKWFESVIKDENYFMLIFKNIEGNYIGQIRIQKISIKEAVISISIDSSYRGRGYAKEMLIIASKSFLEINKDFIINAYIKDSNLISKFSFEKAGFKFHEMVEYENFNSFHYKKSKL